MISDPILVAWAAGLFEGEGCISIRQNGKVQFQLGMTDKDVMHSYFFIVGVGTLRRYHPPSHRALGRKPTWMWRCGSREALSLVDECFRPYLHSRRLDTLDQARRYYDG